MRTCDCILESWHPLSATKFDRIGKSTCDEGERLKVIETLAHTVRLYCLRNDIIYRITTEDFKSNFQ